MKRVLRHDNLYRKNYVTREKRVLRRIGFLGGGFLDGDHCTTTTAATTTTTTAATTAITSTTTNIITTSTIITILPLILILLPLILILLPLLLVLLTEGLSRLLLIII